MLVNLLFSFIGIGVIFAILMLANRAYKAMLIPVEMVNAGTTEGHVPSCSGCSYTISPFESFYHNGKKVNPRKYIVKKVDGDCMVPRSIYAGNLLFIEKFNGNTSSLSIGDILYIKYVKKSHSGYKIREYRGLDTSDSQKLQTLYYTGNGTSKSSSQPHELSKVEGVVRMKFAV